MPCRVDGFGCTTTPRTLQAPQQPATHARMHTAAGSCGRLLAGRVTAVQACVRCVRSSDAYKRSTADHGPDWAAPLACPGCPPVGAAFSAWRGPRGSQHRTAPMQGRRRCCLGQWGRPPPLGSGADRRPRCLFMCAGVSTATRIMMGRRAATAIPSHSSSAGPCQHPSKAVGLASSPLLTCATVGMLSPAHPPTHGGWVGGDWRAPCASPKAQQQPHGTTRPPTVLCTGLT